MSRAWQSGDVAIRRSGPQITRPHEQITVAVEKCFNEAHGGTLHWHHASGGWDPLSAGEFGPTYRPLVVIDPEDESGDNDISRLCALIGKHHGSHGAVDLGLDWCSLQAALREFADPKPPKPAEPTGLGAVVEDADGDQWARAVCDDSNGPWCRRDGGARWAGWSYINAVRVLSEGVTA